MTGPAAEADVPTGAGADLTTGAEADLTTAAEGTARPVLGLAWKDVMPFAVGILLFALLALFNHARGFDLWRNYALSGILLGAPVVYAVHRSDVQIPHYIQWTIVGALLSHYGGGSLGSPDPYRMGLLGMHGVNGAYHHFDWWDHLTHTAGIGASAMGIAYLIEVYQTRRGLGWSGSGIAILSILGAMTAGVGVELYEFLGKTAFQTIDQGGYENTMRDLHFNFLGAAAGATFAVTVNRTRFQARILSRWQPSRQLPEDAPLRDRVPPAMMGFVVFVTLPALAALFLSSQFFTREIPVDDLHLYDPALQILVAAAAAAVVAAPVATFLARQWLVEAQCSAP